MSAAPPGSAVVAADAPPAALGWWIGVVQALLAVSWTVYVLFLPTLAARAGLPASAVIWIVLFDQAVFVLCDWSAAVFADRIARAWRRIGGAIVSAALLSGVLFTALPWIADTGSSSALLFLLVAWAAVSSFMRAPVLALIGRIGGATRQGWSVGVVLGLVALAGALGPRLTEWLRGHDPHWPFALASAALALAGLVALRADAWPLPTRIALPDASRRSPMLALAGLLLLAALGFQWHTTLLSKASPLPWAQEMWAPVFWGGFGCGLLLSSRALAASRQRVRGAAVALGLGAVGALVAVRSTSPIYFVAGQVLAGAAWGITMHSAMALAVARSAAQRLASPVGLMFSAIALAALCRVAVVAFQAQGWASWPLLPFVAWGLAALGFWRHPWRSSVALSSVDSPGR